jgi:subtilisin
LPSTTQPQQYVLLPPHGLRAATGAAGAPAAQFLRSIESVSTAKDVQVGDRRRVRLRVVDSISPDGAKLVEATPEAAMSLRAAQPSVRLVPVVYYTPAVAPPMRVEEAPAGTAKALKATAMTMQVMSGGAPVANAIVVAFTNFAAKAGAQGVTDAQGRVSLALGGSSVAVERLYVYPEGANWSMLKKKVAMSNGMKVSLSPLDLVFTDGLRYFYGNAPDKAGAGITVGVIDTGVATHPDLVIAGGANTVPGEDPKNFGDNGHHHGTHVAGIIAARGAPPTGVRGVAPGVTLRAYRVFGQGSGSASSFAIAKAIDLAVAQKCDLLNMSLGGGSPDPTLQAAVEDARTKGSVCIIAAGNGGRQPVSFPATDQMAVAVTALGRKGTFPAGTAEADTVTAPYGTDKKNYIADFSNVGPEVDLTGPGVGIISTVPGGYAEISGTSMACPAVTGAGARIVAAAKVSTTRNAARSAAMVTALLSAGASLGFAPELEGHGLPKLPK